MFRVDEGRNAAALLGRSDGVKGQRRLTGRFGAVNFDDAAAGIAADADCQVNGQGTGRNDFHIHLVGYIAETHDRALAEILLDLAHCVFKRSLFRIHNMSPYSPCFKIY